MGLTAQLPTRSQMNLGGLPYSKLRAFWSNRSFTRAGLQAYARDPRQTQDKHEYLSP